MSKATLPGTPRCQRWSTGFEDNPRGRRILGSDVETRETARLLTDATTAPYYVFSHVSTYCDWRVADREPRTNLAALLSRESTIFLVNIYIVPGDRSVPTIPWISSPCVGTRNALSALPPQPPLLRRGQGTGLTIKLLRASHDANDAVL